MFIILINWKLSEFFASNNKIFLQMPTVPNLLKCMSPRQADTDFPNMLFGLNGLEHDDPRMSNATRQ